MEYALKQLDSNIKFVKEAITNSEDEEEKAGLVKLLNDYEALKNKIKEILGNAK